MCASKVKTAVGMAISSDNVAGEADWREINELEGCVYKVEDRYIKAILGFCKWKAVPRKWCLMEAVR